jgi:zinc/manganese transport system permease protein
VIVLVANPIAGIAHIFDHPFLRSAFIAGTAIALACGLVGYFVVLRAQVFTADALSHVAFTGALAALVSGISLLLGLYAGCVAVALAMAVLGRTGRADDTVIGNVFAWILGVGALFLAIYSASSRGTDATTGVNVLFGTIFGLSSAQTLTHTVVSLGVTAGTVAIARPLLFATVDDAVASARRVPVRSLGIVFLGLVGVVAASATQAVGALLLIGLLAAPAGAAQRMTARPYLGMVLAAGIAIGSMWAGLIVAYLSPRVPPSFSIIAVATGIYLVTFLATAARRHRIRSAGAGLQHETGGLA